MSTVLWANLLVEGKVLCEEADHLAQYKHADELGPFRHIFGKYVVGGITVASGLVTYILLLNRSGGRG